MSDPDNNSLLTNLTNKIKYKAHQATYDPDANDFAQKTANQAQTNNTTTDNITADNDNTDTSNSDQFSIKRLLTKIGAQVLTILKKGFFPFLALMLAMIVTNDMIVYSVPIRILFFIFTMCIGFLHKPLAILLGIFYILKGGYSYYYNNMTDRPKKDIMPTIFALLPITTYKPMSSFSSFFLYPFTYPKTDAATIKLPELMAEYWEDLQASFTGLDKVKRVATVSDDIKQIHQDLLHLHDQKSTSSSTSEQHKSENVSVANS